MAAYTALYRTNAEFARKIFEAQTPEAALCLAAEFIAREERSLVFERYAETQPLQEITITDPEGAKVANWLSQNAQLSLGAEDMLTALEQALIALNAAPRFNIPALNSDSSAIATLCEIAIKKAKGEGDREMAFF